jgi:hypothetical protein
MVTALFRDRERAENAFRAASELGYRPEEINLIMADKTRNTWFPSAGPPEEAPGSKALEGTGTGAAIGGVLGGALGALAAIGTSLLIPGLGLIIAGPVAAGLAGMGAGGLTGGLIGALVGSGIPEEHARTYEAGLQQGGVVIAILPHSETDAESLHRQWTDDAEHVHK